MDSKDFVLASMRNLGRQEVEKLQSEAPELDDTAIIDKEEYIPDFDPEKQQFLNWKAGTVVRDNGQVWKLLQPYDSTAYKDSPEKLRVLWGLCHTKDPKKAKPYVPSYGTSGMYMEGECCIEDGCVYVSKVNNNVFSPSEYPSNWELYNAAL